MIMSNLPNFPHRDDMDFEMIQKLQEMFPGKKIVFLGDLPDTEITAEYVELVQGIEAFHDHSLNSGRCVDCGLKIPDFDPEKPNLPDGWNYLTEMNSDKVVAYICSKCNEVDDA